MPPKKPGKSQALVSTRAAIQKTQSPPQKERAKISAARALFIRAYELSFGNITQSCHAAGIGRATYYRWLRSPTKVNQRFRARLANTRPHERRLDALEAAHAELVAMGDTAAVIFGLKTQGRVRGWTEKEHNLEAIQPRINQIKTTVESQAIEKGVDYLAEMRYFLAEFGDRLQPEVKLVLVREMETYGQV